LNKDKIQIAVVDDDESFARAVGRLLRTAGFGTAIYHSAEAFLQDLGVKRVQCLVLDIQLGGMSGFDLGRRLVEIGANIPFIFLSVLEEDECRQEARQIGCSDFLHKPVSGQLLIGAIRHAVDPSASRKPN